MWKMFSEDSDLEGTDWDDFLNGAGKDSSIEGHVGILVDKADTEKVDEEVKTRADEKEQKIYPYVALYRALNILDWEWDRDKINRPFLKYLKLYDDEDRQYRLWWPNKWEIWEEPELTGGVDLKTTEGQKMSIDPKQDAVWVGGGDNPLGEIPFVWLYNVKTAKRSLGKSDLTDIAPVDASIICNLSQADEIIDYGAFPMMRKPKPEKGETPNDEAGITAILEFDPEHPESKPDWLTAAVKEPMDAIMNYIAKKIEEIYRTANVGGMASMEVSTQAKSGAALQAEFQLLNAKLVGKGRRLKEAEETVIRYWMQWQEIEDNPITVERAESYDVANLAQDLANIMTANTIVKSETFKKTTQKKVARIMLPGESDADLKVIDDEIDSYEPPVIDIAPTSEPPGGSEEDEDEDEGLTGTE
jgi:hypothetical protein